MACSAPPTTPTQPQPHPITTPPPPPPTTTTPTTKKPGGGQRGRQQGGGAEGGADGFAPYYGDQCIPALDWVEGRGRRPCGGRGQVQCT
jgi:hypothetical protein